MAATGPVRRFLWLVFFFVMAACGSGPDTEEAPSGQASTTLAPTAAAPGSGTIAPAILSPEEVYSLVAPSIPLIETPTGTGSGILIEGGYVVTNHHVTWPYDGVRVVFPDGTEFGDVPVVGWDAHADLAVLGPVAVSAPTLNLADGEGMSPGSQLYLIGFPAEAEPFPQPTITGGVLSRVREWDLYALTLLQSDADIAGGQSGGAVVNASGDVVGISTWSFSDAEFSVATSAADAAPIVFSIIRDYESAPPDPASGDVGGEYEFAVGLVNAWDEGLYFFKGAGGSTIEVAVDGPSDGFVAVVGPTGVVKEVDDTYGGREYGIAELPVDGPYLVVVGNHAAEPDEGSRFTLTSTVGLTPFSDPDDGQSLSIGEPFGGILDYHGDVDWYEVQLEQGDTVVVWTEAIATDTAVYIGHEDAGFAEMVWDDDSGPAVVGESANARLYYTAPISGTYSVIVEGALGQSGDAYFVGVDLADPLDAPVVGEDSSASGAPDDDPGLPVDYGYDVGPGTTWRDLFDTFEPTEQDCIRRELGGALLEPVLAAELLSEDYADQFVVVFLCLEHDTATEVYISALVGAFAQEGLTFELESVACLREVFAVADGAAFLVAIITDAGIEEFGELSLSFISCFPAAAFEDSADATDREAALAEISDAPAGQVVWWYRIPFEGQTPPGESHVYAPVLAGDMLFLPTSDGAVYALSASDGAPLWTYRTHPEGTSPLTVSLMALEVAGGVVSIVTGESVHGIDAGTGEVLWLYPGSFVSAPGVGHESLFVQSGLDLEAVDIRSGSRLWSFNPDSLIRHAPVVDEGVVYFGADWQYVYAIDALTGELEWRHGIDITMYLSPVVAGGIVYAATFDNTAYALDASTGRVIWQTQIPGSRSDLLELVDGLLYLSVHALHTLDPATGETVWRFPSDDSGGPHLPFTYPWAQAESYFTVDRGVVYFGSDLGGVFALDAATGRLLWEYQTVSDRPAAPTVSGDVVLLGSLGGGLYALDAATGQLIWYYPTIEPVIAAPLVADGLIYVTTAEGLVHAVQAPF